MSNIRSWSHVGLAALVSLSIVASSLGSQCWRDWKWFRYNRACYIHFQILKTFRYASTTLCTKPASASLVLNTTLIKIFWSTKAIKPVRVWVESQLPRPCYVYNGTSVIESDCANLNSYVCKLDDLQACQIWPKNCSPTEICVNNRSQKADCVFVPCYNGRGDCDHNCTQINSREKFCTCNDDFVLIDKTKCFPRHRCLFEEGGCEQNCQEVGDGLRNCSCKPHYRLVDETRCEFVPCYNGKGYCDHQCTTMNGDEFCSCNDSFVLIDKTKCFPTHRCQFENGGCEQKCQEVGDGLRNCSCKPHYRLVNDTRCEFVPCYNGKGYCDHQCTTMNGDEFCSCNDDFVLIDKTKCFPPRRCLFENGGCEQNCHELGDGLRNCSCNQYYQLENETSCVLPNPCIVNNGACQHFCHNTGYKQRECFCEVGFDQIGETDCLEIPSCRRNNGGCKYNCVMLGREIVCVCPNGVRETENPSCSTSSNNDDVNDNENDDDVNKSFSPEMPLKWFFISIVTILVLEILVILILQCMKYIRKLDRKTKPKTAKAIEIFSVSDRSESIY